jgi:hypothetical protein
MAKGMKYHPSGSVLACTFSLEEGILLLANSLCKAILRSCIAAALEKYPVRLCHFIVEGTHVHMVFVVINPEHVPEFLRYVKTESAHMLNNLLGRNKRTVWCEGYDSPIVLTPLRALVFISYLYANPAKDALEISIDRYPGFSSWKMFRDHSHTRLWKRVRRAHFRPLSQDSHNLRGYEKEAGRILAESSETLTFTLTPDAWLDAFGITDVAEQARWNRRIVERVRHLEERFQKLRERKGRRVMGAQRLMNQKFDLTYRPTRTGRRMWCLSEKRRVRQAFITFLKDLMCQARSVYRRWRSGDFSVMYPPGLHAPSMPRLANVVP